MHPQAHHAIRAARNWTTWTAYGATRYAEKRGVHPALLRLARQLEAVKSL